MFIICLKYITLKLSLYKKYYRVRPFSLLNTCATRFYGGRGNKCKKVRRLRFNSLKPKIQGSYENVVFAFASSFK